MKTYPLRPYVHVNGRRRCQLDQHLTLEEVEDGCWQLLEVHPAVKPLKRARR